MLSVHPGLVRVSNGSAVQFQPTARQSGGSIWPILRCTYTCVLLQVWAPLKIKDICGCYSVFNDRKRDRHGTIPLLPGWQKHSFMWWPMFCQRAAETVWWHLKNWVQLLGYGTSFHPYFLLGRIPLHYETVHYVIRCHSEMEDFSSPSRNSDCHSSYKSGKSNVLNT